MFGLEKKRGAFFEIEDWETEYIKQRLIKFNFKFYKEKISDVDLKQIQDVEILGVFIYSFVNKEILDKLPKLKLVITMSTGFDHINIEECKKRNIKVCNVPYYGENTVAEHTFALLLAISRKITKSYERTSKGSFNLEGLRGFDLKGKIIGIVGTGHIGIHVIRMAKGFEMNVIAYDKFRNEDLAKKLDFKYLELKDLLSKSDIITLHVPYNKETHHMINKESFSLMKKGVILINTARGAIIDTDALVQALDSGIIGYAGLDVLEGEKDILEEKQLLSKNFDQEQMKKMLESHILLQKENVLITPHNAFNSTEALQRILDTTIENINNFYSGKIQNEVR
mgnify:CR=1 FL=1